MAPPSRRDPLVAPLLVSLGAHLLLAWGAGEAILAPAARAIADIEPAKPPVRLELVETPESAAVAETPADTERISTTNTRAQDRAVREARTGAPQAALGSRDRPGSAAAASQGASSVAAPPSPRRDAPRPAPEVPSPADATASAPSRRAAPAPAPEPASPAAPAAAAPPPAPRPATPAEAEALSRAAAEGEFSYAAAQHFFARYLAELKRSVENQWLLALMSRFTSRTEHRAVVDFLVLPDGTLGPLQLAESEGDDLFAVLCIGAVKTAAPFGPVPYHLLPAAPAELPEAERLPLRIRFTFEYD